MRGIGRILVALGWGIGMIAGASAPAPATAASPSPEEIASLHKNTDYHRRLAAALATEQQPRSLAFAALLQRFAVPDDAEIAADPQASAWLREADARAGADAVADLLLAGAAESAQDQPIRRAAAHRWAAAEADNLAPLFFTGDSPEAILAAARTRTRFDLHWSDAIRWMADAIARHPALVDPRDLVQDGVRLNVQDIAGSMATSLWAAYAIPAFGPVTRACRGTALAATIARREQCMTAGRLLRDHADTLIGNLIGNALIANAAADPVTTAEAARYKRRIGWLMDRDEALAGNDPRQLVARLRRRLDDTSLHGEREAMERDLREAHVPLDPPPNWKPAR